MVRVGTAGWSIPPHAAGQFPADGSHLARYAARMDCCEINSSFYRSHRAATWQRWAETVPAAFRFAVKAPRAITHESALRPASGMLESFLAETSALGKKRGPLLFQLPPSGAFENTTARDFIVYLRSLYDGPAVFEPRHASWFTAQAEDLLREFQVARCAADPARHPGADTPGADAALRYYRLHGSPRMYYSQYSGDFLAALAERIAQDTGAETWVVFDNTANGHALGDALRLREMLLARSVCA